jgi:sigma-B regulation protein RsbU (phosphoserine phosphatase)
MNIEPLLAVTRRLAAPVDLTTLLEEVVAAAKQVLDAERGSVWLYDRPAHELVLQVSTGLAQVRLPADQGIVGTCARERQVINVRDCYADPRFNPEMDRQSRFRTRCMLTLPLVDHKDVLVGVLQVLNKNAGVFDDADEKLALALAAQCAVALQRAQMTEALIDTEKMRHELEMAREVQMGTLPSAMPAIEGYDVHGTSIPADLTGGDTFDVSRVAAGMMLVLGDATGHGLAPALHVTQMHAMLRMAMRLGADLDDAVFHLNNQLADVLPPDRFITAFIGLLDTAAHTVRYHSAGQAPILHFSSALGECMQYGPTTFPLAALPAPAPRPAVHMTLAPGDVLVLLSDGIYEYANPEGELFGDARVAATVAANCFASAKEMSDRLLAQVAEFARGARQEDDITLLLVKRDMPAEARRFRRSFDSIPATVDFRRAFFAAHGIPESFAYAIDFTIEELFTNMVKYGNMSTEDVQIELRGAGCAIHVLMVDPGVDRFDVTQAPDVDVGRTAAQRRPGGPGLHLVRRVVDSVNYEYDPPTRTGRTRFQKVAARGDVSSARD